MMHERSKFGDPQRQSVIIRPTAIDPAAVSVRDHVGMAPLGRDRRARWATECLGGRAFPAGALVAAATHSSESTARAVATTVHLPAVVSCATACRPIPVEHDVTSTTFATMTPLPVLYAPWGDGAGRSMGVVPLPSW